MAACLASSRGLQPCADFLEDRLELGIALQRIEVIILENAPVCPACREHTVEGGDGPLGITGERMDAGLVIEIPAVRDVLCAEDILSDLQCPPVLAKSFIEIPGHIRVKAGALEGPCEIEVLRPEVRLDQIQRPVDHLFRSSRIAEGEPGLGVRVQDPGQIGMVLPEAQLGYPERSLKTLVRGLVIALPVADIRQIRQWPHEVRVLGPESILDDVEGSLGILTRLAQSKGLRITSSESAAEPRDDWVVGSKLLLK